MMWIAWIAAGCVASWIITVFAAPGVSTEVFFGMLGPLVAVGGTWALVERTARLNPAALTSMMMAGFFVKMVFFGLYVAAVVTWWNVERTPFIASFTGYFVTLYAAEALRLRRLSGRLT